MSVQRYQEPAHTVAHYAMIDDTAGHRPDSPQDLELILRDIEDNLDLDNNEEAMVEDDPYEDIPIGFTREPSMLLPSPPSFQRAFEDLSAYHRADSRGWFRSVSGSTIPRRGRFHGRLWGGQVPRSSISISISTSFRTSSISLHWQLLV